MNQELGAVETNSFFEAWNTRLRKQTRHWKVTAGAGASQGGDQGRELTRLKGLLGSSFLLCHLAPALTVSKGLCTMPSPC